MLKYISVPQHLDLILGNMSTQDGRQKGIQFESFHVFKFFVANPRKPPQIVDFLCVHKTSMLETLRFMAAQEGVEYGRELPLLIEKLKNLK